MKAAVYTRYGPPDVVRIEDVQKPIPDDNQQMLFVIAHLNPRQPCFAFSSSLRPGRLAGHIEGPCAYFLCALLF